MLRWCKEVRGTKMTMMMKRMRRGVEVVIDQRILICPKRRMNCAPRRKTVKLDSRASIVKGD